MREHIGWTDQHYRCLRRECGHRGPAAIYEWKEPHPYGEGTAMETLSEAVCEKCGNEYIQPIDIREPTFFYIDSKPDTRKAASIHHEITKLTKAS